MRFKTKTGWDEISRRDFLKFAGLGAAGVLAASCQTSLETGTIQTASQPLHTVAICQVGDYVPISLSEKVSVLLENIDGVADILRTGDAVALKVNLTGGKHYRTFPGIDPTESYITHPALVRALGEHLLDAGAGQLYIVEALYDADSFARWGYDAIANTLGATLIDLNQAKPYDDFDEVPVGDDWYIYENFKLNRILNEVHVFVSISKMKCHLNAGVTHSMKNLVGITPVQYYRVKSTHFWRSALHGDDYGSTRLPRVIVDLNRARPIHLALIDGIKTSEGGEVPRGSAKPVAPGVLISGKNPVATDAVATAVMGFDPSVVRPNPPFLNGDNHLNLACNQGLGSNDIAEINVVGTSIEEALFEFAPATRQF
jgi:uncharacterized protein (DUF362 family)